MHPPDIVHKFLTSIGRPEEARTYLELFRSSSPERFAIIVGGDSISAAGALASDLAFLSQLGLYPVLACKSNAAARSMTQTLARAAPVELADTEMAGELARRSRIAIVEAPPGAPLTRLAQILKSQKVVFLHPRSGLQPEAGPVRSMVDLRTDLAELRSTLSLDQQDLLDTIVDLMSQLRHRVTVSVTSPLDLLRELFTVKGAGTLVRRGSTVSLHSAFSSVDAERLAELFRSAFGSQPSQALFSRDVHGIYVADEYRGAAVLEVRESFAYLSKFAVDVRAQGEGIGGDLWRAMRRDHDRVVWRSRPSNPIASWYQQKCEGLCRRGRWTVFWTGLRAEEIPAAISTAEQAPVDFEDGPPNPAG